MTKVTIDRELLERELLSVLDFSESNLRRVVDHLIDVGYTRAAPRQPEGGHGWLVSLELPEVQCNCAWNPDSHDKTCPVYLRDRLSDAQRAIAELREEISALHTTMMAAAVEIQAHWEAHCDEEGYGPANLMHRLERGIASQYGYTAQTIAQAEAERDTLRQQLEERDATIGRLEAGIPRLQEHAHQTRQQRDKLAGLLADVKADYTHAIHWEDLHATMKRIDAALAEVKPCPESHHPATT